LQAGANSATNTKMRIYIEQGIMSNLIKNDSD
jgi:hypothetical protein